MIKSLLKKLFGSYKCYDYDFLIAHYPLVKAVTARYVLQDLDNGVRPDETSPISGLRLSTRARIMLGEARLAQARWNFERAGIKWPDEEEVEQYVYEQGNNYALAC